MCIILRTSEIFHNLLVKRQKHVFQMAATENVTLKDELDALRETAAKAATLEAAVASYKKRMEEHVDLRRQVAISYS